MVLVTGATGFVGRHVVAALTQRGAEPVRCLVHRPRRGSVLQEFGVKLVQGDVRDPEAMRKAVEGVRAVVHLVATIREGRRWGTFEGVNRQGTRNLVAAAGEAEVEHFVYMSALGARENPRHRFAYSKWQAEQA
ncbi:MAG: NAD(P)H-binding protein, partial [Chloroflexi bacterium]|nr:NAD(P)H-binding protein [Chloroflexota bacterium]